SSLSLSPLLCPSFNLSCPLILVFYLQPLLLSFSLSFFQTLWSKRQGHTLHSWQSAVCGAFAGAVAAFVTTPLDVAKTRIMLAKAGSATAGGNIPMVLCDVWRSKGLPGLFAGSVPRMAFISVGGFIFLGAYEKVRRTLL
ncbi:S-adenosylmethionine mitochondrial carrier protein-like, partial [Poecilia latipinna]|uniref:S-adenosylmethionine mitochondrial carrier protein-like n=1 Tax=Poecilia formosa TaxID=48698 RepID=UPI0004439974